MKKTGNYIACGLYSHLDVVTTIAKMNIYRKGKVSKHMTNMITMDRGVVLHVPAEP